MKSNNSKYHKIIELKCPISYEDITPENQDQFVVLQDRVYDSASLQQWLTTCRTQGSLRHPVGGEKLPGATTTIWDNRVINYMTSEHFFSNYYSPGIMIAMVAYMFNGMLQIQKQNMHPFDRKGAEMIIMLQGVVAATIIFAAGLWLTDHMKNRDNNYVTQWMSEHTKPYNPKVHKTAEEIENLSSATDNKPETSSTSLRFRLL